MKSEAMAEREVSPGNVVHVELISKEPEQSKKFYREVFGWRFQEMPEMNYAMRDAPNPPTGGI